MTKLSLCSDPRDTVYSLINIARDCSVVADYTKTLSEVYQNVMMSMKMSPESIIPYSELLQECMGQRFSIRRQEPKQPGQRRTTIQRMPALKVRCYLSLRCRYVGQPWDDYPQSRGWADVLKILRTYSKITELDITKALTKMATKHEKWVNCNDQSESQAIISESLQPRFEEEGMEKYRPRTG